MEYRQWKINFEIYLYEDRDGAAGWSGKISEVSLYVDFFNQERDNKDTMGQFFPAFIAWNCITDFDGKSYSFNSSLSILCLNFSCETKNTDIFL